MRLFAIVFVLSVFSITLLAEDLIVYKTNKKKTKVLVDVANIADYPMGTKLSVTEGDLSCAMTVVKIYKKRFLAKVEGCEDSSFIAKGVTVTKTVTKNEETSEEEKVIAKEEAAGEAEEPEEKAEDSGRGRFYAGMLYNMASQIDISGQYRGASTGAFEETADSASAIGVVAGYANMAPKGFGFSVDFSYEMARTISSYVADGSTFTITGTKPTITVMSITGNSVYSFSEMFYAYVGGSLSSFSTSGNDLTFSPGFGYQAGAGMKLFDMMLLDFGYRIANSNIVGGETGTNSSSSVTADYKEASMSGLVLSAKYLF